MKKKKAVALAILATALASLVAVNLIGGKDPIREPITTDYAVRDPQFPRAMGSLLGPAILPGNRVQGFENGDEIFPAMLAAIREAERSITFETYIYWAGQIGREFSDALSERSRAGVRVHVLLDWAGSGKMDEALLDEMVRAGVEIEKYHRPRWYDFTRLNNRTHRKLLVVDGKIGFTGGVGIADLWLGDAQDPDHWRDSHFRLDGPAVAQMQSAFMDNWLEVRPEVLHGELYFPPLAPAGTAPAQVFSSSPESGSQSVRLMYLLAIAAARETIHLASSYFVPDDLTVTMLVDAAGRGVRMQLLLPGPFMDVGIVQQASRSRWGELLRAGIEISEYQPTMFHRKVMVVDGLWVSVGSTNFNDRSFRLNDEANVNVFDGDLARRQIEIFEADLRHSRRVTLEQWEQRPLWEKIREHAAGLLRSQL